MSMPPSSATPILRTPTSIKQALEHPIGLPNANSGYDVRQLHARLPGDGGIGCRGTEFDADVIDALVALERRGTRRVTAHRNPGCRTVSAHISRVPGQANPGNGEPESLGRVPR